MDAAENDLAERATPAFAGEVLLAASYEAVALQMTWIAIGMECASEHVRSTVASLRLSTEGPQSRLRADWLDSGGEPHHLDHPLWARPLQPVTSPGWLAEAFAMAVAGHV